MIKMKLGGSNDPSEAFPQKPRGMHWRTYRRLRDQANAAEAEADYLLAKSIPGLGQFLDFMPPRPKRRRRRHDGGPKPSPAPGSPSTPPQRSDSSWSASISSPNKAASWWGSKLSYTP